MTVAASTVLLVDDSPEDRAMYEMFLRESSTTIFTFLHAETGEEALRTLRQATIDCVILDFGLPDMEGFDVLERINELETAVRTPVIMVTGRGSEKLAVRALKLGACDYISKSDINPNSLYRAMHNAIELNSLNQELAIERSDREQAELELQESEQNLRLLIQSVQDYAIFMLSPLGIIVSWNAGARRLLNYHDQQAIGQHYQILFSAEDLRSRVPESELSHAAKEPRELADRWYVDHDGQRIWGSMTISPVFFEEGQIRGFSVVLRDIGERRQALIRLEDAVRARDDFTGLAGHELRTPLTALALDIQRLVRDFRESREISAERFERVCLSAEAQVMRLKRLVNTLIDASMVVERDGNARDEIVELGEIVRSVAMRYPKNAMNASDVQVRDEASVRGAWDRSLLERILENLVHNAVKFGADKGVHITVGQKGSTACIEIADHGSGIAPDDLQQVFEKYHTARNPALSGLGLGLFAARHLAELMGGSVEISSEMGVGSVVKVLLPLRPLPAPRRGDVQ